jgi:sulfite reductase alpha subunit-like flavoprotein
VDSSTQNPQTYQNIGRMIDKRLEDLGATRMMEFGEGDDSNEAPAAFNAWTVRFWDAKTFDIDASVTQRLFDESSMEMYVERKGTNFHVSLHHCIILLKDSHTNFWNAIFSLFPLSRSTKSPSN